MALILTGQFTPEQALPPEPDIHADVVFQTVKVLQATGYVVMDGATPEVRLRANTSDDGVVQIGMLINYGDEPNGDYFHLPDAMERCIGKDLQFGDNIVGEIRKGYTPASEWGYQGQSHATAEILSATLNAADTSRIFVGLGGMSVEELAYFQRPDLTADGSAAALEWIQGGRVDQAPLVRRQQMYEGRTIAEAGRQWQNDAKWRVEQIARYLGIDMALGNRNWYEDGGVPGLFHKKNERDKIAFYPLKTAKIRRVMGDARPVGEQKNVLAVVDDAGPNDFPTVETLGWARSTSLELSDVNSMTHGWSITVSTGFEVGGDAQGGKVIGGLELGAYGEYSKERAESKAESVEAPTKRRLSWRQGRWPASCRPSAPARSRSTLPITSCWTWAGASRTGKSKQQSAQGSRWVRPRPHQEPLALGMHRCL